MTFVLLLATLTWFVWYFWMIGLWYLWFIPVIFLLFLLSYYTSSVSGKVKIWQWRQQYLIFLAWIVILIWLGGSLHFFGMTNIEIAQIMIVFNLIFWIGSYLLEYEDGKSVFQLWYYLSIIWLVIGAYNIWWWMGFWNVFSIAWTMNMAIIWFLVFVMWLKSNINKYMRYEFWIAFIGTIILIIVHQIKDFYIAMLLSSLLLTSIYYTIYKIIKDRPPSDQQQKTISVRRILAGERITQYQKPFKQEFHRKIYDIIIDMPILAKYALEGMNILLILIMIIIYINNIWKVVPAMHEWLYRIIIASFIWNVVLLKRVNYSSVIQRLIVFAVINFAIYVSLFSLCNGDLWQIVWSAVLWNIFCAILIFYAPKIWVWEYFKKIDYIFWLITTLLAMVLNIALFNRTNLPWQLLFSIVFLYVGIQAITLFYATKYISRMEY